MSSLACRLSGYPVVNKRLWRMSVKCDLTKCDAASTRSCSSLLSRLHVSQSVVALGPSSFPKLDSRVSWFPHMRPQPSLLRRYPGVRQRIGVSYLPKTPVQKYTPIQSDSCVPGGLGTNLRCPLDIVGCQKHTISLCLPVFAANLRIPLPVLDAGPTGRLGTDPII